MCLICHAALLADPALGNNRNSALSLRDTSQFYQVVPIPIQNMPKEQYMCQLCANHGIFNQPKKGHKQKCMYRSCSCNLCALNTKRRALDQMERQLKQNEDVRPPYSEDSLRGTLPPMNTIVALPPSPNVTSIFPTRVAPSAPYCVALPAIKNRRDIRFPKKEQNDQTWSPPRQSSLEAVLEQISAARSIFHSAEQLAG